MNGLSARNVRGENLAKMKKGTLAKKLQYKRKKSRKSTDISSQDKMLEVVMSTMSNFTEKLNSMEERLTGLTSRLETPATSQKTVSRKSCLREKVKRIEILDDEEKTPVITGLATVSEDKIVYAKTFPDVAVAIKPTPARPKKLKADPELGVAPLLKTDQVSMPGIKSLPRVTSTVSRPQSTASVSWDAPAQVNFAQTALVDKPVARSITGGGGWFATSECVCTCKRNECYHYRSSCLRTCT